MIRKILLSAVCLLLTATAGARAQQPVAVLNHGFEAGDGLPAGWTPVVSGARAVFIWDRALARTGGRSLYLRNYGPRWATWRSDQVAVRENTRYRLGVWVRIVNEDAVSSSNLYLRVRGAGRWTAVEHVSSGAHADWRQYVLEFETGTGIDSLSIELSNLGGKGTEVWFDDLELAALPPGG